MKVHIDNETGQQVPLLNERVDLSVDIKNVNGTTVPVGEQASIVTDSNGDITRTMSTNETVPANQVLYRGWGSIISIDFLGGNYNMISGTGQGRSSQFGIPEAQPLTNAAADGLANDETVDN